MTDKRKGNEIRSVAQRGRRALLRPVHERILHLPGRVSLVWILPVLAVLFAGIMLWRAYVDRGPLVTVAFDSASGVIAGETKVMNNDVMVGTVERVRLSEDLSKVLVDLRMNPQVAPWIDEDARFWVVNAQINTTEISGLGTLLSGAYVGVDWDLETDERQSEFVGLEEPPLTKRGTPGLRVSLIADEAGYVYVGSPVFFRQLEVGRVERRRLSLDGERVLFDIFIEAPYHRYVHKGTRFYGVSGAEANITTEGASVRVESIAAFFTGGAAFENFDQALPEDPVLLVDGVRFKMFDSRAAARESMFDNDEGDERFRYIAEFEGSVKGLRRDAPIEFNGVQVGRVNRVVFEPPSGPDEPSRSYAELQFQPRRLGLSEISSDELTALLNRYFERGMRVQLASGNLLTGALLIKLGDFPEAGPAEIDVDASPYPSLPTVPSGVDALAGDVETLLSNLSQLPLDSLVVAATELLRDTRLLVSAPGMQQLPAKLNDSLAAFASAAGQLEQASADLPRLVNALSGSAENAEALMDGLAPGSELYLELSSTVRELRTAARSIANFAELLEKRPNALITGR